MSSPDTVLRRFLKPVPTLTARDAAALLIPDGGFSLVDVRGEELAGIVTVQPADGGCAAAVWVADTYQRRGVGSALMQAAVREAAKAGFEELRMQVHPDNAAVLPMIAAVGLRARVVTRDGVTSVIVPLRVNAPTH